MKNAVITGRAAAALDEVMRWADTLQAQALQAEIIRREKPEARVVFPEGDPHPFIDGNDVPRPHLAIVRNLASEVLAQHTYYLANPRDEQARQNHFDAAAAWRFVLGGKTLPEVRERLLLAVKASAKSVPACGRLLVTATRGHVPADRKEAQR